MLAASMGLLMIFYHFSNIAEVIGTTLGFSLKLIYVITLFAGVAIVTTGAIQRTIQHRAIQFYLVFVVWMCLSTLTSTWRGGSIAVLQFYFTVSLPMVFAIAGLISGWKALRASMVVLGVSAAIVVATTLAFGTMDGDERLSLTSSGTLGNSNDLASHLVFLLPIQAYLLLDRKSAWYLRVLMLASTPLSVLIILRTASRGAFVALLLMLAVAIWKASAGAKVFVIGIAIAGILVAPLFVPQNLLDRLTMKSSGDYSEAEASADARWRNFESGLRYTLEFPITGIGPGQFPDYDGKRKMAIGEKQWHATHCTWIDISCEIGIPALLLILASLWVAASGVNGVYRLAREQGQTDIANLCLAFMVAWFSYLATITFLSNAYRFYLPALIGFAVIVRVAGVAELSRRKGLQPSRAGDSNMLALSPRHSSAAG
jgi:O-antigen ligase